MAVSKKQKKNENATKRLYRSKADRIIGGVAGGLGEYFSLDPNIIRVFFILITLFGGSGIILYILMWILLPNEERSYVVSKENIQENVDEIQDTVEDFTQEIKNHAKDRSSQNWYGIIMILFGLLFLFYNFGLLQFINFTRLWPFALILLGISLLVKNEK